MKVSIFQFKPVFNDIFTNFESVIKGFSVFSKYLSDVVVLPELWSTGFYPQPIENFADENGINTCNFLSTLASKYSINIIGGSVIVKENGKFYNRSYIFDRNGKIIATYNKIHLFSMTKENEVFSPGDEIPIFEIDGIKSAIAICYDIRFPELIRKIALNGISMLFVPAAWPLKRLTHWQILNRARAIENQIFVIAANSAGHSTVINPWGEILVETELNKEIATVDINLDVCQEIRSMMNVFADCRDFKIKIH